MIYRLQVNDDGTWGTLNMRTAAGSDNEARVMAELTALQTTWQANYRDYKGALFRIVTE